MIKILDCTLRDGGYLVDWNFGKDSIYSIVENLSKSGIDFIELGFLKECNFSKDKTFFSSVSDLENLISENQKYTLMVNFGEYDIANFFSCENKNVKIRVAFKSRCETNFCYIHDFSFFCAGMDNKTHQDFILPFSKL